MERWRDGGMGGGEGHRKKKTARKSRRNAILHLARRPMQRLKGPVKSERRLDTESFLFGFALCDSS